MCSPNYDTSHGLALVESLINLIGKRLASMTAAVALLGSTLIGSLATAAVTKTTEILPSGLVRETRQLQGSITGNLVDYTVIYPQDASDLPVFFHQYGQESQANDTEGVNERVAGYGAFSVFVSLSDSHCGYELQDYKDAIDDAFDHYAGKVDTGNVTIAGVSYAGGVTYAMAERFPYLFDAVIPIYGVADFGYDETESWYPMVLENSPTWGVIDNMNTKIGDRATYRETRYLVRNSILGAKNNKYAHYEILHDVDDGVNKTGVQVELSRRYVAELQNLGYTNYNYTETPKTGFVYPSDSNFPSSIWGQTIRYTHGFWDPTNMSLYEFELNTLKPNMLSGTWQRPAFDTTGEFFVPSFLEVPQFRFDLGDVQNNCDEAADVSYDVSSTDKYSFQITPRTLLTKGKLQLMQLQPNTNYTMTCQLSGVDGPMVARSIWKTDADGNLSFNFPGAGKDSTLLVECSVASGNSSLQYETLFLDDFQSDTPGIAPGTADLDPVIGPGDIGNSWKFTTAEPAETDFQVLNNQDVTGTNAGSNNYLKLSNAGGASANVWAELSDANKTTNQECIQTEFDLYLPEDSNGGNFVFNGFETTGYAGRAFNVYISPVDGAVNYYNGSAMVSTGLSMALDQWVHVTMTADMTTKKFDITIDGVDSFTGADMFPTSGTVGALNMNAKLAYIDNLQLTVIAMSAIPGDANNDGRVDGSDVTILAGNWQVGVSDGQTATWEMGDFNGDGRVDGSDVTILAGNWQYGVEKAAAGVPEPSTIMLMASMIMSLLVIQRQ